MVNVCVAYNCHNTSDVCPNLMFHSFPNKLKDKVRYTKWVHAVKRKKFSPSSQTRLCSSHFTVSDYLPPVISGPLRLKKDAVPFVFDFPDHWMPKDSPRRRTLVRVSSSDIQQVVVDDVLDTVDNAESQLKNRASWEAFFADAEKYIRSLKCDGEVLLEHKRRTYALGFLINTVAYKSLALELLMRKKNPLFYFLPYKTSQDHVELTFCLIWTRSGRNNNPHSLELTWILRKMLFRNSIKESSTGNCSTEGDDYYFNVFSFGDEEGKKY